MPTIYLEPNADGHFAENVQHPLAPPFWPEVDDGGVPDEDTTYVQWQSVGNLLTFFVPNVSVAQIPDGSTINSVTVEARTRRTSGSGTSFKVVVAKGTADPADVAEGPDLFAGGGYADKTWELLTDPHTGAAWAVATTRGWASGGATPRSWGGRITAGSPAHRATQVRVKIDFTPPAAALAYVQGPTAAEQDAYFDPVIQVEKLTDGVRDTAFTDDILLAIGADPSGGNLTGVTTVAAVAGLAQFPGVAITKDGQGYTLIASATAVTSVESAPFAITKARRKVLLARNIARETSTSTGTDDFALAGAAATRYRTLAQALGIGPRFLYFLAHQTALEWEEGIGYLSGSAVLVRERVLRSSNAGALVSFTAGTKDVIADAGERSILLRQWARLARCGIGEDLATPIHAAPGTMVLTAGTLYLSAIEIGDYVSFDEIALRITVAGAAGTTIRLGLYGVEEAAKPSRTMFDAATVLADVTGLRTITINETHTPGIYWAGVKAEGGTPTVIANPAEQSDYISANDAAGGIWASWQAAGLPAGALPIVFPTTGVKSASPGPRILLKRSA